MHVCFITYNDSFTAMISFVFCSWIINDFGMIHTRYPKMSKLLNNLLGNFFWTFYWSRDELIGCRTTDPSSHLPDHTKSWFICINKIIVWFEVHLFIVTSNRQELTGRWPSDGFYTKPKTRWIVRWHTSPIHRIQTNFILQEWERTKIK